MSFQSTTPRGWYSVSHFSSIPLEVWHHYVPLATIQYPPPPHHRQYWMIYRGPGFLAVIYDLVPRTPIPLPTVSFASLCTTWDHIYSTLPTPRNHRQYWTIYRGPGFVAVVWFGSSPTASPPPLYRQFCRIMYHLRPYSTSTPPPSTDSIEWFIEGQAFSRSYDWVPRPFSHPPRYRQ